MKQDYRQYTPEVLENMENELANHFFAIDDEINLYEIEKFFRASYEMTEIFKDCYVYDEQRDVYDFIVVSDLRAEFLVEYGTYKHSGFVMHMITQDLIAIKSLRDAETKVFRINGWKTEHFYLRGDF